METETLFTSTKWEVLKAIAENPSSPLQIAKTLNTSIANVSQQLRLLELAGLVSKKRLPRSSDLNTRIIYYIKNPLSYCVLITNSKANKKFIKLNLFKEALITSWMIEDENYSSIIQELIFKNKDSLDNLNYLAYNIHENILYYNSKQTTILESSKLSDKRIKIKIEKKDFSEIKINQNIFFLFINSDFLNNYHIKNKMRGEIN